jgi:serine/threonine protein kinase/Tol biopolymer transport system component
MLLASGTRLGPYEILAPLGAGGMGEVYRARDSRLGRDVAIKVLPEHLTSDLDARARFEREARTISRLQHPQICALYDVGHEGDVGYLVMELLDGETIARRLTRGALSIEETLTYGGQIAGALAHAHEHGVIHRDLKTSNVIVTRDGRARVLDFGLATFQQAAGDNTRTNALTTSGSIVGTPHYMAPEVLRGAPASPRSDIWALGALLYEMASGRKPFTGRTEPELTAAILHESPAPLAPRLPPGIKAVIRRCLAKDPAQRFGTAVEVRAALEALRGEGSGAMPGGTRRGLWASRAWRIALGLLALLILARSAWLVTRPSAPPRELKQRQLTSNPVENIVMFGAISPDGKTLAVTDQKGLWLRSIESGESHPLPLPEGLTIAGIIFPVVSWDHDGSRLLLSGTAPNEAPEQWVIPVLGGRARKIIPGGHMATFSPDGKHIAYVREGLAGSEIWCAGAEGEDPRLLAASDTSGVITTWASWAPNGRRVVYGRAATRPQGIESHLETCDLGGHRLPVFIDSPGQEMHIVSVSCWLPDDRMVFGLSDPTSSQADMNLWWIHVDPTNGGSSGKPHRITQWQGLSMLVPTSASADGKRLAVGVFKYESDVYVGTSTGPASMLKDVRRLTLDDRSDIQPTWTPDGKDILFASNRNETYDVFRQPLSATEVEPLVTGPGDQLDPHMSPDGAFILYRDVRVAEKPGHPTARLMRIPAGAGAAEKVTDLQPTASLRVSRGPVPLYVIEELSHGHAVFTAIDPIRGRGGVLAHAEVGEGSSAWDPAPDGSALATVVQTDSLSRIEVIPLRGGNRETVRLRRPFALVSLAWTPDGRGWIAAGINDADGWRLLHVGRDGSVSLLTPRQFWMYSAECSPDGRHIAFTNNAGEGNVWMLEDF